MVFKLYGDVFRIEFVCKSGLNLFNYFGNATARTMGYNYGLPNTVISAAS